MIRWALISIGLFACSAGKDRSLPDANDANDIDAGVTEVDAGTTEVDAGMTDPWAAVESAIDAAELDDFTVQVGTAAGIQFTHSKGVASPATVFRIASASKWLSGAVFMTLVDEGVLSLDDHPQDHLSWWTSDPNDARSRITLEQLLSFTSGLPNNVRCGPRVTVPDCAQLIYGEAATMTTEPGTTFAYGGTHMQIAGAMALAATGGSSFDALFRQKVADPLGLSAVAGFPANPMIAGSASMSLDDYAKFLQAVFARRILMDRLPVMERDHTPNGAVVIESSPLARTGFEWHYGLGQWRECYQTTWTAECDASQRISSPGAFGFYPMIDRTFTVPYWLILSREEIGSGSEDLEGNGAESVLVAAELRPLIEAALLPR